MTKETKEITLETESLLINKNKVNNIEHKEEFSIGGSNRKKNISSNNEKNDTNKQEFSNTFPQTPYYMFNPKLMSPQMSSTDSKEQMNQGMYYYFYPVYIDPTKMPKDMNGQNTGMFYPPMIPMYPQNFIEKYFIPNTNNIKNK